MTHNETRNALKVAVEKRFDRVKVSRALGYPRVNYSDTDLCKSLYDIYRLIWYGSYRRCATCESVKVIKEFPPYLRTPHTRQTSNCTACNTLRHNAHYARLGYEGYKVRGYLPTPEQAMVYRARWAARKARRKLPALPTAKVVTLVFIETSLD